MNWLVYAEVKFNSQVFCRQLMMGFNHRVVQLDATAMERNHLTPARLTYLALLWDAVVNSFCVFAGLAPGQMPFPGATAL
jgi:hypothetical protein